MCKCSSLCGTDVAVKLPMGSRPLVSLKLSLNSVQGISNGEHQEEIVLTSNNQGVLVLNAVTQVRRTRRTELQAEDCRHFVMMFRRLLLKNLDLHQITISVLALVVKIMVESIILGVWVVLVGLLDCLALRKWRGFGRER
jgi:hypothetical protein